MRALALACALALCGCGGSLAKAIATDTSLATATAIDKATDAESKKKVGDLAASAADAALDKLTDEAAKQRVQAMVHALGETLRAELAATQTQVLDVQLRQEVAQLRADLGAAARDIVRQAIDEALSERTLDEFDAARERLVGEALRQDLDAFLAKAGPGLGQAAQQAIAPVQAQVDAEGRKAERIAVGLGGAIVLLAFAWAIDRRSHRQRLAALEASQRAGKGTP